jgi:hypothetical protein
MKYLVSSYTRLIWAVNSGEVGGEVGTRFRMCHRGWEVWVHGGTRPLFVVYVNIVRSMVSYYVCCRVICTYILIVYILNFVDFFFSSRQISLNVWSHFLCGKAVVYTFRLLREGWGLFFARSLVLLACQDRAVLYGVTENTD